MRTTPRCIPTSAAVTARKEGGGGATPVEGQAALLRMSARSRVARVEATHGSPPQRHAVAFHSLRVFVGVTLSVMVLPVLACIFKDLGLFGALSAATDPALSSVPWRLRRLERGSRRRDVGFLDGGWWWSWCSGVVAMGEGGAAGAC
jgi:hypothetical protein